jgi:hypothetical protein
LLEWAAREQQQTLRDLRAFFRPVGAHSGRLRKAGYKSREKVRADIKAGALHPFISINDYGKYADAEVRIWLGMKSWEECWGTEPRVVRRHAGK